MVSFPNAKINLGLNVVEKRTDGYHNLETVFYPVPLEDALEITEIKESTKQKFILTSYGIPVEGNDEDNLIVKAYKLLDKEFNLPPVHIHLYKHIPMGAGLGGGSSDAAYMLKLLNETFKLGLTTGKLEDYAATLGADCAFFIQNKPTFARGIGNIFSPISLSLAGYSLIICKPDVFVSTKDAFAGIKPKKPSYSLEEIITRPVTDWKDLMTNDFEESVFPKFPVIREIKEELYNRGAVYASMSGSGSAVFGIFEGGSISRSEIQEVSLYGVKLRRYHFALLR